MAQLRVDRDKCALLGVCESLSSKYFQLNDDGDLILPVGEQIDSEDLEEVREAALGCPVEAISVEEDAS